MPTYTSEELLNSKLFTNDPAEIEAAETPPPSGEVLIFRREYKLTVWLRCSFGHHPHKGGYIVEGKSNGVLYRLGNICGRNIFGLNFKDFEDGTKKLKGQQTDLAIIKRALDILPAIELWLSSADVDVAAKGLSHARSKLRKRLPQFCEQMRLLMGREMIAHRQERDASAERRQREAERLRIWADNPRLRGQNVDHLLPAWVKEPVFRAIRVSLGSANGAELFDPRSIADRLAECQRMIKILKRLCNEALGAHSLAAKPVNEARRQASAVRERLAALRSTLTSLERFATRQNLAAVSQWANENQFDHCSYSTRADGAMAVRGQEKPLALKVMKKSMIDFSLLDRFEAILTGGIGL
jgi:hypothetical protein